MLVLSNVITDFNSFHRRYHSPVRRDHADTGVSHASGILGLRGSCGRSSRLAITLNTSISPVKDMFWRMSTISNTSVLGSAIQSKTSRPERMESIQPSRQYIAVCTPTQNRAAPIHGNGGSEREQMFTAVNGTAHRVTP